MKCFDLEYRGVQLRVEIKEKLYSSLYINGIRRDSMHAAMPGHCFLSTTVQTDYEWHEFIEAELIVTGAKVVVKVSANNQTVGTETLLLDT